MHSRPSRAVQPWSLGGVFAWRTRLAALAGAVLAGCVMAGPGRLGAEWRVGLGRTDITPEGPIRLTGFASRKSVSAGVGQRLWAKAVSLRHGPGADDRHRVVLVTLDLCGISEDTMRLIWEKVGSRTGLGAGRLILNCSHTHCGPMTTGWAPNIFAEDVPEEQRKVVDGYTHRLVGQVTDLVAAAVASETPATLEWSEGRVEFAKNRRTPGGPVDHSLPVLRMKDRAGDLKAIVANYACHCTTMGGDYNLTSGDWSGFAQQFIEADHPGALALITTGCGADSNPLPRGGYDFGLTFARQYGGMLATEVRRLMTQPFKEVGAPPRVRHSEIQLPFKTARTREEWLERSPKPGIVGYHARKNLQRLERGESIPKHLFYPITTWTFGEELCMVFLPGEVVVDYVHRIRREHNPTALWVSAYSHYVPCYIPSRRILKEGGYEAEDSLWYYDRPQTFAPEVEDIITNTLKGMLP